MRRALRVAACAAAGALALAAGAPARAVIPDAAKITDAVARTGCEPGIYTVGGRLSRSGSSARLYEAMG